MIIQVLGFSALGIGLVGTVYFLIKNGKESKKNLEKEVKNNNT